MEEQRLYYLLEQVHNDTATTPEIDELARFIRENFDPALFSAVVSAHIERYTAHPSDMILFRENADIANKVLAMQEVLSKGERPENPVRRTFFPRRWWAAASILLLLATGAYLWNQKLKVKSENLKVEEVRLQNNDIGPGKDGAILTLADGSQVVLDSLGNGVIANQNGAQVVLKNGRLAYDPAVATAGEIMYNTMTTPKGRQFQVVLPDGTKVWLNAASSIRYPTAFTGKERKVEVNGEAYLEVAKNTQLPFRVNVSNKTEVEVLGTSFNINAYYDETSINTTLLEGSVRVLVGQKAQQGMEVVLKPGQQAQLTPHTSHLTTHTINTDQVLAWKNGLFNFEGASLQEVMRQLERWYDIEVVYEKGVPDIRFIGEMSRNVTLQGVLRGLEAAEVHFRIEEGRRLVVLP